jgi:hypothetical protein
MLFRFTCAVSAFVTHIKRPVSGNPQHTLSSSLFLIPRHFSSPYLLPSSDDNDVPLPHHNASYSPSRHVLHNPNIRRRRRARLRGSSPLPSKTLTYVFRPTVISPRILSRAAPSTTGHACVEARSISLPGQVALSRRVVKQIKSLRMIMRCIGVGCMGLILPLRSRRRRRRAPPRQRRRWQGRRGGIVEVAAVEVAAVEVETVGVATAGVVAVEVGAVGSRSVPSSAVRSAVLQSFVSSSAPSSISGENTPANNNPQRKRKRNGQGHRRSSPPRRIH